MNTGADKDETREHVRFLRQTYAREGLTPGVIADRLRHEAVRYEDM